MHPSIRRIVLLATTFSVLVLLSGGFVMALSSAQSLAPEEEVAQVWARAHAESAYHVVADIQQTLIPRALPSNMGAGDETMALRVLGDVARQSSALGTEDVRARMQFYNESDEAPVELLLTASEVFIGFQGRWRQVEDPLGGLAPGGDYLSFLVAVDDVVELESVLTAEGKFRRFSFELNGPRYAEYQRQRLQKALAGKLPPGVELRPNQSMQAMSGTGELWVDEEGLPRRQELFLTMPETSPRYDARVNMLVDYSRFGDSFPAIELPQTSGNGNILSLPDSEGIETGANATNRTDLSRLPYRFSLMSLQAGISPPLAQAGTWLLAVLPIIALVVLLMTQRQRRSLYLTVVLAIVISIIAQPLLEMGQYSRFINNTAKAAPVIQALQDIGGLANAGLDADDPTLRALSELESAATSASLKDCRVLHADTSSPKEDDDGDTLINETEWCLGTLYQKKDSDGDGIDDNVEVAGFTYNNRTWTSDPLLSDSNGDGMNDNSEWNVDYSGNDFDGQIDIDGDTIPNLWDEDNDGDRVPDGQDISPGDYSIFKEDGFSVTIDQAVTSTIAYLDIQVQPKNQKHLRYSLTALDWPQDQEGNIQDIYFQGGTTKDDITLIPVLSITSNFTPTLARPYGLVEQPTSNGTNLWVPLQTVSEGGNIYAFQARIAFTGTELTGGTLKLAQGNILWLTQAKLDYYKNCTDPDHPNEYTCEVDTTDSLVATYKEGSVRVTGISLTASRDVHVGLFGTSAPEVSPDPSVEDEDYVMFKLMNQGLAGSYLYYENPDLEHLQDYYENWQLDPSKIFQEIDTYTDRDSAMASTTQTTTVQFLANNYEPLWGPCTPGNTGSYTPTLALAYQETGAIVGWNQMEISNDAPEFSDPVLFEMDLGITPSMVMRHVRMTSYGCGLDDSDSNKATWQALPVSQALDVVSKRYPDQAEQNWFSGLQYLIIGYYGGRTSIMSINGKPTDRVGETTPADAFSSFRDDGTTSLPDYVRKVYQLDAMTLQVDSTGMIDGLYTWAEQFDSSGYIAGSDFGFRTFLWFAKAIRWGYKAIKAARLARVSGAGVQVADNVDNAIDLINDFPEDDMSELGIEAGAMVRARRGADAEEAGEAVETEFSSAMRKFFIGVAIIMLITSITLIWIAYSNNSKGLTSAQDDLAKAQAIAATIVVIIQFLISLVLLLVDVITSGIAFLIELVIAAIVYVIARFVFGEKNFAKSWNWVIDGLAEWIVKLDPYVVVAEGGVHTGNLTMDLGTSGSTPDETSVTTGPLPGNWFIISATISTTLEANTPDHIGQYKGYHYWGSRNGNDSDVESSWGLARWAPVNADDRAVIDYLKKYTTTNSPKKFGKDNTGLGLTHCDSSPTNGQKNCYTRSSEVKFVPKVPGRNLPIPFINQLESYMSYQKCWQGLIGYFCSSDMTYFISPGDNEDLYEKAKQNLIFDVLPSTLDDLFTWDAEDPYSNTTYADFNVDQDSDGLSESVETRLSPPTSIVRWDTDQDCLSDGWEYDNRDGSSDHIKGIVPTSRDTDNDGLSDRYEVYLGTSVTISDTDQDGLLDGEEVCRIVRIKDGTELPWCPNSSPLPQSTATVITYTTEIAGGWVARQAGNVYVCSDPTKGDYDGDHLLDSLERKAGLSPYSPNTAPWLQLNPEPSTIHNGSTVSVLRHGDPLTVHVSLNNTTNNSIDQSLIMTYATNIFATMVVDNQIGSDGYQPLDPVASPTGLSWDLSQNPLHAIEDMTSTLTTSVDENISQSQWTTMTVGVRYLDPVSNTLKSVSEAVSVRIDEEEPTSGVTLPTDDMAINGTAYTIGGWSNDVTSWPVAVDVRILGTGSNYPDWQRASDTLNWTWTWTPLPEDGVYTIESRATDYVNNQQSTFNGTKVIVDNTVPGAMFSSDLKDGEPLPKPSSRRSTTFEISGTASDLLSGAPEVAGLAAVQLSIDGRPWLNVAEFFSDYPYTSTWSYEWTVNQQAYGSHRLGVRAIDSLGQIGVPTTVTVIVDTLSPTDMWSNMRPDISTSEPFTMLGHADDEGNVPLPARPQPLENFMDSVISATVLLMPESFSDAMSTTVTWLGDVNGDARADLAVGLPTYNNGAGQVAVIYGQPGGWPIPSDAVALADAGTTILGTAGANLGLYVTAAGDVNSDGLNDILVSDPKKVSAYLIYGRTGAMGAITPSTWCTSTQNDPRGKCYFANNGNVTHWNAPAGDVDGDGYDDLLIGVTGRTDGKGRLYLVNGCNTAKCPASRNQVDGSSVSSMAIIQLDNTGAMATGVGNINNDQYDDFIVADPNNSFGTNEAAVYLFLGPATWSQPGDVPPLNPLSRASASFVGDSNSSIGLQLAALGDVNGDELPDFAYSSGNKPRVVFGRNSGYNMAMTADVVFDGYTPAPDAFIAAPGDVNVDGLNDILLGTSGGGGRAYLILGSDELVTNQPQQAVIANVKSAASAPYAAGADLNCDASSDLLLVPFGETSTVQATTGPVRLIQQGPDLGPSPKPRSYSELPAKANQPALASLQAQALTQNLGDSLTANAVAFRIYDNNINDWVTGNITETMMVGDWDGDDRADIAGWTGTAWRTWHAEGLIDEQLEFNEYSHSLPSIVTASATRIQGDFDGAIGDDLAVLVDGTWQFVRSTGASGGSFGFAEVTGSLPVTDTTKMFLGDFNGDQKTDVTAWDNKNSIWVTYLSQATSSDFSFTLLSNNLGNLVGGNVSAVIPGDFNGDLKTDVASRNSDSSNWVIWLSGGVSGNDLSFKKITDTSLGFQIKSSVPRTAADFSGDGVTDVLAELGSDFMVWLAQTNLPTPSTGSVPFRPVPANPLQFNGNFPSDTLIGDFDGDNKTDYASLNPSGDGWIFQLAGLASTRYVDDDYCEQCGNDGNTWDVNAFKDIQSAVNASWFADTIIVQPGVYGSFDIHAGQDYLTVQGTDPDAVFLDAGGSTGITVLPNAEVSNIYPNIEAVTIRNFTIRNAVTGILVNFGGLVSASPGVSDERNVVIENVLFYQDIEDSKGIETSTSAVWIKHNTLVSNAPGVTLVLENPGILMESYTFLQDNLFVALPNETPLPTWWKSGPNIDLPGIRTGNGFASANGEKSDWNGTSSLSGSLYTITSAKFLNVVEQIFRIGPDSAARSQAGDGTDQGYYTYHEPVYVDADYCSNCDNEGRTWGDDAYNSIQAAIDSGAQRVLVDPGVYRERISLVNGVSILGTGAGLTFLAPPDEEGGYLVGVENARQTSLALMTVTGEDSGNGIKVDAEGSVDLKRLVVRNTGTAVSVTGSGALATLVNNTIVSNNNGVVASQCGNLDLRNSILAFHQQAALSYETTGCPSTQTLLHTFNDYWRNGSDLEINGNAKDEPGSGEIFVNPLFTNPSKHDYRPLPDSPVVDAGNPSDPAPPGSGLRVDLGYAQSAEASVYASKDYCEVGCLNDGLEWGVTAFDTIQEAIDHVPDIDGVWTVGVDGGGRRQSGSQSMIYAENLQLKSGIRLVGSGADTTLIDGNDNGSVLTLDGVTNVEITGFTISDSGENPTDAGIYVTGASNHITITRNIIGGRTLDPAIYGNGNIGVLFQNGSTGYLYYNTLAQNLGAGVTLDGDDTWLHARYNVIAFNDVGFDNSNGGQIFNSYNLVYNTAPGDGEWCATCINYVGTVSAGPGEINADPLFSDLDDGLLDLTMKSPAVDAIPATQAPKVRTGGGVKADMGYEELLAMPATLLLGKQGNSCGLGASGISAVEVGLVQVPDASVSITDTMQSITWSSATLATEGEAGSYWTYTETQTLSDGLYRLYSKPADVVGNVAEKAADLFRTVFIADSTAPSVTLITPGNDTNSTAPALSLRADVSDWVPAGIPGETLYNIADVYFQVDGPQGMVITATQVISVASQSDSRRYQAEAALENGAHTIIAYAVDKAGNIGQSAQAQVSIVTTQNQAALANPTPGSAVNSASLALQGYVHFQDTAGDGKVTVLVDNASVGDANLGSNSAQTTSWNKNITLSGDGAHTLTLQPSRTAGSSTSANTTVTLILDRVAPAIQFEPPEEIVTGTITLQGQASDATSGLASLAVSIDGGYSYDETTVDNNGNWTSSWTPDLGNDYVSFPVRIKATDVAGNSLVKSTTIIVDNLGPTPINLVELTPQTGSYVYESSSVELSWEQPSDGSGVVDIYVAVDQITNTVPSGDIKATGNSYSAILSDAGTWYVHLATVDSTGNRTVRHFGPWFAESQASASPVGVWYSSVQVDGLMNFEDGEWDESSERLGFDPQPSRPQAFYTTWDSENLFLGWQGANWGPHGDGYIYLDTQPGGSSTAYTHTQYLLPFEADYVVVIPYQSSKLLRYNQDGAWEEITVQGYEFAHSANGDTEISIPRTIIAANGAVQLMAASIETDGYVYSVFPTANPAAGPWHAAYSWSSLDQAVIPNAGQPDAHHTRITINSPDEFALTPGPGSQLHYVLDIVNWDDRPLEQTTLIVSASEGLILDSLEGWPSAQAQSQSERWFIDLGSVPPGEVDPITIVARVADELSNIDSVTFAAQLEANIISSEPLLAQDSLRLDVDSRAPAVSIDLPESGATLQSGLQRVSGWGTDVGGGGIDRIETQINGGPWTMARGTRGWSAEIDVPDSGQFELAARAVDIYGYISDVESVQITVDNMAPTASLSLANETLRGSYVKLSGQAVDTFPEGGEIQQVEIIVDDSFSMTVAPPFDMTEDGTVLWSRRWLLPTEEGIQHTLRVRAIDAAGNKGPLSEPEVVTVDSIRPVSIIAYPRARTVLAGDEILVFGLTSDGWGVAAVEVSPDGGNTWYPAQMGDEAQNLMAGYGEEQAFSLELLPGNTRIWAIQLPATSSNLAIRSRAIDLAGNVETLRTPVRVSLEGSQLWLPLISQGMSLKSSTAVQDQRSDSAADPVAEPQGEIAPPDDNYLWLPVIAR